MTEETKATTPENPPVVEDKPERDVSYKQVLKTLDVDEEERKFLQEQYKAQLASKVAENEIKALKKDFYNQVTELRANKKAGDMFQEKLNNEEKFLKEKGYEKLSDETIKEMLSAGVFNATTHKQELELAKSNPIIAKMLLEKFELEKNKPLASNSFEDNAKEDSSLEMSGNEKELFVKYQNQIKTSSLTGAESKEFKILKTKNALSVGIIKKEDAKNLIKQLNK